jgi:lambda family phage minor tail protein L
MAITSDVQKLAPGKLIDLFELRLDTVGGDVIRWHPYTEAGSIWWQGEEYVPWAVQATGFERTSETQQPRPTLTVGNIGKSADGSAIPGVISALCIAYDDLVGVKLIRHRTLAKYLDAKNFAEGNASADPDEHMPDEVWFIEQKQQETKSEVEFTLSTGLDFSGRKLPGRQIIANLCGWKLKGGYRGTYCGYTGSAYFDENGNRVTDPTKDKCPGRLSDCKKRFAAQQGVSEDAAIINFGGFPSANSKTY